MNKHTQIPYAELSKLINGNYVITMHPNFGKPYKVSTSDVRATLGANRTKKVFTHLFESEKLHLMLELESGAKVEFIKTQN